MTTEEKIRWIEDFMAGDISAAEIEKFEQALQDDLEMQSLYETESQLKDGIRFAARNELKAELKKLEAGLPALRKELGKRTRRKALPLLVAASVTLLVALYFVFNQGLSNEELYQRYYEPYSTYTPVVKRGEGEVESPREKAMLAYEKGNYSEAVENFRNLPESDERDFFLAQSYMALEETGNALELLSELHEKNAQPESTITWYLSLAYLKSGENLQAKELLKELERSDNAYSLAARDILKELD